LKPSRSQSNEQVVAAAREALLEVGEQAAPVAQAGERVGERLPPCVADDAQVVAERGDHPRDHGDERRARERHHQRVEVRGVGVGGDAHRDRGEHTGRHELPPARVVGGARRRRGLPGGDADQQRGDEPAQVEDAGLGVGSLGDLRVVDAVGDGERDDAGGEHGPRAVEHPAAEGDRLDEHGDQHDVVDGVGDRHRHGDGRPARGLDHGLEDERGGDGGDGARADHPVEGEHAAHAPDPAADQQHDRDRHRRIHAEVEGVAERRDRHRGAV
jgi:hypothetical protein